MPRGRGHTLQLSSRGCRGLCSILRQGQGLWGSSGDSLEMMLGLAFVCHCVLKVFPLCCCLAPLCLAPIQCGESSAVPALLRGASEPFSCCSSNVFCCSVMPNAAQPWRLGEGWAVLSSPLCRITSVQTWTWGIDKVGLLRKVSFPALTSAVPGSPGTLLVWHGTEQEPHSPWGRPSPQDPPLAGGRNTPDTSSAF